MRLSDKMIVSPSNNSHDIDPQIVAVRENSKMRDQGNPRSSAVLVQNQACVVAPSGTISYRYRYRYR